MKKKNPFGPDASRRGFLKLFTLSAAGTVLLPKVHIPKTLFSNALPAGKAGAKENASFLNDEEPAKTNIADALKYPRTSTSMPGKYPARVVQVENKNSVKNGQPDYDAAYLMIKQGMLALTGEKDLKKAWRKFVTEKDRIGLKINPVAGVQLSTSHAVVKAVIRQLEEAGISRENLVIWDRREFEMHETGFTPENYPGITITGTERKDKNGSFYDAHGKLYGEEMIDKTWYYRADCEEKYDAETIPYMINEGKESYFSKIVTQQLDKIINIPILKNAGSSVTLALKNLAYGSISNTGRLHKSFWADTCAEVNAFPPLRDKVVLNIADGLIGCYQGGPAANAQFITNFNTILISTDPVAIDRIGYEIILRKRIAEKIQKEDIPKSRKFMDMAEKLELGTADLSKIKLEKIQL